MPHNIPDERTIQLCPDGSLKLRGKFLGWMSNNVAVDIVRAQTSKGANMQNKLLDIGIAICFWRRKVFRLVTFLWGFLESKWGELC
jgi:hypothetical protein